LAFLVVVDDAKQEGRELRKRERESSGSLFVWVWVLRPIVRALFFETCSETSIVVPNNTR
jgi:hypothetical protein